MIERASSPTEMRKFAAVLSILIVIIFAVAPYVLSDRLSYWPWAVAAVLMTLALVRPLWLAPLYKFWLRLGEILGIINTTVILGVLFMAMFVPVAIWRRLRGVDPLERQPDPNKPSYRKVRESGAKKNAMERMF